MPLADLLIATEAAARAGANDVPVPVSNLPPDAERLDIEGCDRIPLTTPWCLLSGREVGVGSLVDAFERSGKGVFLWLAL